MDKKCSWPNLPAGMVQCVTAAVDKVHQFIKFHHLQKIDSEKNASLSLMLATEKLPDNLGLEIEIFGFVPRQKLFSYSPMSMVWGRKENTFKYVNI